MTGQTPSTIRTPPAPVQRLCFQHAHICTEEATSSESKDRGREKGTGARRERGWAVAAGSPLHVVTVGVARVWANEGAHRRAQSSRGIGIAEQQSERRLRGEEGGHRATREA